MLAPWTRLHSHTACLRQSHNEKFLLSSGGEGAVRIWEIKTKELITHLKEHKVGRVLAMATFISIDYCSRVFVPWHSHTLALTLRHTR